MLGHQTRCTGHFWPMLARMIGHRRTRPRRRPEATHFMLSLRRLAGVLAKDMPLYILALFRGKTAYLTIRNRAERLTAAPDGSGYRCDWQWTRELHAPKVIPSLGLHLMQRALADHPIGRADAPSSAEVGQPDVSFLIGHRGIARLPHLLATLRSIAAQEDVALECIVVEQETVSRLGPLLPSWVRLVHTPPPDVDMPFCRSWAFNVAASHARGRVLVLHDNDLLMPIDYAAELLRRIARGYELVNLKRFVFYLSNTHTQAVFGGQAGLADQAPETTVQNTRGGGSVAITASGFERIGGMDETFVGWGGEDNEFWERAQTLKVWPWANLSLVHLWHAPQPGKREAESQTARHYSALAQIDPEERIRQLRARKIHGVQGPN
jgi:hypothetical protein